MPATTEPLVEINAVVRRVVSARVRDRHLVEDLTQETLVRVAAIAERLDPDATRAYAIVTARNLIADHVRAESTRRRHQHRLVEYRGFDGPEQLSLERDETDALATALHRLDADDRALLLRHEADGEPLERLAADAATSQGAIKMRLARARAALRVEFVVAFRRATLPTSVCHDVLTALSAGDRRRQRNLDAAGHLLTCPTCVELARPVTERNRGIAAWLIAPGAAAVRSLGRLLRRNHVAQAVLASALVAAGTVAFALTRDDGPGPSVAVAAPSTTANSTPTPTTVPATIAAAPPPATAAVVAPTSSAPTTTCRAPVPLDQADPAGLVGCPFAPTAITPIDVAADEGFWAVTTDGRQVWVDLTGTGESPVALEAGRAVSVSGTITAAPTDPTAIGLPAGGDPRLDTSGYYLQVDFGGIAPM